MKKSLIAFSLLLFTATLLNAEDSQNTILYKKGDNLKPQNSKYYQPIQAEESGLSTPKGSEYSASQQANELISAAAGNQEVDKNIVKNSNKLYPEANPVTETAPTQKTQYIQPIQAVESGLSTPKNAEDSTSNQANELISAAAGNPKVDNEKIESLYPKTNNEAVQQQKTKYMQPIQAEESGLSVPKSAEDSASEQANDFVSAGAGDQPVDKTIVKDADKMYPDSAPGTNHPK
ncbi:MAG: hypothetical protein GY756_03135 [bacterium]|nr:hypothetical protein [bacterium]